MMPINDCSPCCAPEDLTQSLVSTLFGLARFRETNNKSWEFIRRLTCLRVNLVGNYALRLDEQDALQQNGGNYIAVSYCWEPTPGLDCVDAGKYRIKDARGQYPQSTKVRNEVLIRVIKYARRKNIDRIWIDQECISQEDGEAKQVAMDSMDLVYRHSNYPLGLLSVVIRSQEEIDNLQQLLRGDFVRQVCEDYPTLSCAGVRQQDAVLSLLQLLYEDKWWTRAWIFQEEYISSTAMHILVRHEPKLETHRDFGIPPGEFCFNAAEFRHQATLFLLAYKQGSDLASYESCERMFERFGRYSLQYDFQHEARGKAMSPRILADIQRRGVTNPYDRLPIAANSCDYEVRLHIPRTMQNSPSIGLCLLALYLLNGEILRDARIIEELPTKTDLCNYLQDIAFDGFDPPVDIKHLSYLKDCRLHQVSFNYQGIVTIGHLWEIEDIIETGEWHCPWGLEQKSHHDQGLNNFQRGCLHWLVCMLRTQAGRWQGKIMALEYYLEQDLLSRPRSSADDHMDLMAEVVVEAIRSRERLYIAGSQHSAGACAFFVGMQDPKLGVFTSWHAGEGGDGRFREKHVSLGVRVRKVEQKTLVETVQWVNGLTFFKQCEQTEVTFEWPCSWK